MRRLNSEYARQMSVLSGDEQGLDDVNEVRHCDVSIVDVAANLSSLFTAIIIKLHLLYNVNHGCGIVNGLVQFKVNERVLYLVQSEGMEL